MWIPDIRTLFLILFLVNVFLTLLLFSFWKSQKTYDGFRTWMLSLLVISCGYFLLMTGGSAARSALHNCGRSFDRALGHDAA